MIFAVPRENMLFKGSANIKLVCKLRARLDDDPTTTLNM